LEIRKTYFVPIFLAEGVEVAIRGEFGISLGETELSEHIFERQLHGWKKQGAARYE
jgi:hypothetical protein